MGIPKATPLVSVIIPSYNRPHYLREAVASALQQTYRHIEVIVTDNASPQNPKPFLDAFGDSRLRFHRNANNTGMVANLLKGVQLARGKYIAFLHDDDIWRPQFLETLVPNLEASPIVSVAFSDHYLMNALGKTDPDATHANTIFYGRHQLREGIYMPFQHLALVQNAIPALSAAVYRKSAIDWNRLPIQSGHARDLYLAYLTARRGHGAYYSPLRLTHRRVASGDVSGEAAMRLAQSSLFVYETFLRDDGLRALHPRFEERCIAYREALGLALLRAGHAAQARRTLFAIMTKGRWNLRALSGMLCAVSPKWVTSFVMEAQHGRLRLPSASPHKEEAL